MTRFDFTAVLAPPATAERSEQIADALYGGRCDDTSVHGSGPTVFVTFHREAETFEQALRSAVADLRAENLEVDRIEIDRDDLAPLLADAPAPAPPDAAPAAAA